MSSCSCGFIAAASSRNIIILTLTSALLMLMSAHATSSSSSSGSGSGESASDRVYTNEFAVNLHQPSRTAAEQDMDQVADQVAKQHGFINRGQIGSLDSHYLFEHISLKQKSSDSAKHHLKALQKDHRVRWVEQQYIKSRRKGGDEL